LRFALSYPTYAKFTVSQSALVCFIWLEQTVCRSRNVKSKRLLQNFTPEDYQTDCQLILESGQVKLIREPVFLVPFERDPKFVGRSSIIRDIDDRIKTQRRVALCGIGGIG